MADEIQAEAEPVAPTVVDPDASLAALPDASSSQTTIPTEQEPTSVDFDKVDGDAYEEMRDQMAALPLPVETAAPEPEPVEPAAPIEAEEQPIEPEIPTEPEETETHEGKDYRPRLKVLPKVAKEAIALAKEMAEAGTPIDLSEAESRVKAKYGITPGEAPAAAVKAPEPDAIQREIASLREELKAAATSADTIRMGEITIALEEKRDELQAAKEQLAESTRTASQRIASALDQSKAKAQQFYSSISDPNSALSKKWDEHYATLKELNDPLLNEPDAPFRITQMAARDLNIAPVDSSKKAALPPKTSPPAKSISPAVRPVQPAPGSARSSAPANPTGQLAAKIDGLKSLNDYESMMDELHSAKA